MSLMTSILEVQSDGSAIIYSPVQMVLNYGLEGQVCSFMSTDPAIELDCEGNVQCERFGVNVLRQYPRVQFCCLDAEQLPGGGVLFHKSVVVTSTQIYQNDHCDSIPFDGFDWGGIAYHTIESRRPLGIDEVCSTE